MTSVSRAALPLACHCRRRRRVVTVAWPLPRTVALPCRGRNCKRPCVVVTLPRQVKLAESQ
eukprot:12427244-Karenia_brevis.AAC.1